VVAVQGGTTGMLGVWILITTIVLFALRDAHKNWTEAKIALVLGVSLGLIAALVVYSAIR